MELFLRGFIVHCLLRYSSRWLHMYNLLSDSINLVSEKNHKIITAVHLLKLILLSV